MLHFISGKTLFKHILLVSLDDLSPHEFINISSQAQFFFWAPEIWHHILQSSFRGTHDCLLPYQWSVHLQLLARVPDVSCALWCNGYRLWMRTRGADFESQSRSFIHLTQMNPSVLPCGLTSRQTRFFSFCWQPFYSREK